MKKKFILKIVLNLLLILILGIAIYWLYSYRFLVQMNPQQAFFSVYLKNFLLSLFIIISSIISIVIIDIKDISYLCGSLFKEMKEHKEATKEERKQKKIEELEKQLNELKKDE